MKCDTDALDACQRRIGYQFRNRELLRAAMIHASSADHRKDSNERLEFLGDTVLALVICHALYERLPSALEGELTKIKSAVVSRRVCARVAENLRLPETLVLGQGMEAGEQLPSSLAAGALEAVIAAVFLDGGLEPVRELILTHMAEEIREATESEHQGNFKSQLQQYAQRHANTTPQYELLDEKGPDHSKCFEIAVTIGRRRFHGAWGPSKKDAEQKAAQIALVELGELEPETVQETD